jgi:phytoene dehydrogenase-like protein
MSQPSTTTRYDAIVVGAGHNGLTASAYLARAGLRTLVLERREIVGGACVTEEIAPGCRASTTSYIASMLRPEVIRDLRLGDHGLRMVPCEPGLQVPFLDGEILPWWSDDRRTSDEMRRFSAGDAATFLRVQDELKKLARYLQPYFLEPPPDIHARGPGRILEALRHAMRFRRINGDEIGQMVAFLTGSLGDYLDRNFESDKVKTLYLANNVYGKHGGPYQPGTAIGLLFHLLSGGDHDVQGFYGHVIGGMGAITGAMAEAAKGFGAEIRTDAAVSRIDARAGVATGVTLEDGTEITAPLILSNADPKRTFLGLVDKRELPDDFRHAIEGIKMDGPCAKVNFVLNREPQPFSMPSGADPVRRSLFTLVSTLEFAERCYDTAKMGELPEELWVDCVVASNVDDSLAPPGKHVMTTFIQYTPYRLREGTWDERRDVLLQRVVSKIEEYIPNFGATVEAAQVLTPLDLERTYGLTEGNIFHGDLTTEQLFFMRPIPGWAHYRTPLAGLYLCGAGVHPGGGVTGGPGYNAAHQALRDRKRSRAKGRP